MKKTLFIISCLILICFGTINTHAQDPDQKTSWNVDGWIYVITIEDNDNQIGIVDSNDQPIFLKEDDYSIPGVWKFNTPPMFIFYNYTEFKASQYNLSIIKNNNLSVEFALSNYKGTTETLNSRYLIDQLSQETSILELNNNSDLSASNQLKLNGIYINPVETVIEDVDPEDLEVEAEITSTEELTFKNYNGTITKPDGTVVGYWDPYEEDNKPDDTEDTDKATSFSDIRSPILQEAVEYLSQRGIISGYSDGSFQPEKAINRAEALKIIFESRGIDIEDNTNSGFPDVPSTEWFAKYVTTAKKLDLISGYSDGTYKPDQSVNRVEFIKIAALAQTYYEENKLYSDLVLQYTDLINDAWYLPYLNFMYKNNFLENTKNFSPSTDMTRGDAALLIYKIAKHNE